MPRPMDKDEGKFYAAGFRDGAAMAMERVADLIRQVLEEVDEAPAGWLTLQRGLDTVAAKVAAVEIEDI